MTDAYTEYVAHCEATGVPPLSPKALLDRILTSVTRSTYTVVENATVHTCWDDPAWDGMLNPGSCAGCAEAVQHPCHWCGYGTIFTTHNAEQHYETADPTVSDDDGYELVMPDSWTNSPHVYKDSL